MAYASNESGRYEVYVQPFPDPGGKWQASTGGGNFPRWARDGSELFYVAPDNQMMSARVQVATDGRALTPGAPVALFPTRLSTGQPGIAGYSSRAQYAVAPDGRFLMKVVADDAAAVPITLVQNWTAGLGNWDTTAVAIASLGPRSRALPPAGRTAIGVARQSAGSRGAEAGTRDDLG